MRLEDTATLFDLKEFPTTREQVCAEHGDCVLELADGETTVTAALERAGDEKYASYEALRTALFCGLPASAVGRLGYSDRDAPAIGEDGPTQVSF